MNITMQPNDFHSTIWQHIFNVIEEKWHQLTAPITDEMLLTVSEKQVNDALCRFVTKNVQAILQY